MSKTKLIKPVENYRSVLDPVIVARATAVATGMTGNLNFLNPPAALQNLYASVRIRLPPLN
jgi:hypothetical protein